MNPVEENMPGGAYRKEVYACIQAVLGRELTDNEHTYLSKVLKAYATSNVVINKTVVATAPRQHVWTCDRCKEEAVKTGAKANMPMVKKARRNKKEITQATT